MLHKDFWQAFGKEMAKLSLVILALCIIIPLVYWLYYRTVDVIFQALIGVFLGSTVGILALFFLFFLNWRKRHA